MTLRRSHISEQVVASPNSWSASRSFMSTIIHSVTLDYPSVVMSPKSLCHVTRPSVLAFSYVPDNVCHTTVFRSVCTLSVLQGDSHHDSLHLPLGCDQFLKLGVAKWSGLTAICHYWECILAKCFPVTFLLNSNSSVHLNKASCDWGAFFTFWT